MELKLRQRLVGAVVIVALAIIFIPMLFKGSSPATSRKLALNTAPSASAVKSTAPATAQIILADQNNPPPAAASQPVNTTNQSQTIAANQAAVLKTSPVPATKTNTTITTAADPNRLAFGDDTLPSSTANTVTKKVIKPVKLKAVVATAPPPVIDQKSQLSFAQQAVQAEITDATTAKITPPATAAWVVQLGSFSSNENAKKLIAELRAQGFTAFGRVIKTSKDSMVKVFVGPEVRRTKADALQAKLAQDLHVKGVVVAFDPLS